MKAIQDVDGTGSPVTIYEYTQNTGIKTFTPAAIPDSAVSCQGYKASWVILDQRTYQTAPATTSFNSWITISSTGDSVSIDTTGPTTPESAQITVRYFN